MDSEIASKGLSGLTNIGNTCFMNSALQCLFHTDIFCIYFLKNLYIEELRNNIMKRLKEKELSLSEENIIGNMKNTITYELYKLFKTSWNENSVIEPSSFKNHLGARFRKYRGTRQQCSYEFLDDLLDTIHEENKKDISIKFSNIPDTVREYIVNCSRFVTEYKTAESENEHIKKQLEDYKKNKLVESIYAQYYKFWKDHIKNNFSLIKQHFTGITCQLIKCNECTNISPTFNCYGITALTLPLPKRGVNMNYFSNSITLDDAFTEEFKAELLQGISQYQCDVCNKKVDALKQTFLWSVPDILIISLKRYHNNICKLPIIVEFPVDNLNLDKYCFETRKTGRFYSLYGIIEHYGGLNGGHYIAYCKNNITGKWFKFDDSNVTYIPDIIEVIDLKNYYVLFYSINTSKIDTSHINIPTPQISPNTSYFENFTSQTKEL